MPYIKNKNRREQLTKELNPKNGGELNFLLFYLGLKYITTNGLNYKNLQDVVTAYEKTKAKKQMYAIFDIKYDKYYSLIKQDSEPKTWQELTLLFCEITYDYVHLTGNDDWDGTVRCSQMEFYNRYAAPYEKIKIEENGDVIVGEIV